MLTVLRFRGCVQSRIFFDLGTWARRGGNSFSQKAKARSQFRLEADKFGMVPAWW